MIFLQLTEDKNSIYYNVVIEVREDYNIITLEPYNLDFDELMEVEKELVKEAKKFIKKIGNNPVIYEY